jgi:uncharacterized MAPEG superfamily protein
MTTPLWVLLGFSGWTLVVMIATVGAYRWSQILTGRMKISEWRGDRPQGPEWYRRAMRAHMNCVENLPIFGAVVVCTTAAGAKGTLLDALALAFIAARACQTTIHIACSPTDFVASVRFAAFLIQALCVIAMGIEVALFTAT